MMWSCLFGIFYLKLMTQQCIRQMMIERTDENLTWKQHIAAAQKKVCPLLYFMLSKSNIGLPPDSLRIALVHQHLSYGITVWSNAEQNVIRPVTSVQKGGILAINNASITVILV